MNRYISKSFLTLIIFFICIINTNAQNNYNFKQLWNESFDFVELPLKWQSNDWSKAGIIAASTILLMYADQPVRNNILKDRSHYKSFPIEAGRVWGEWYTTPLIVGFFAVHGLASENNKSKKIAFEIFQSAGYTFALTNVFKFALGRARPYNNKGNSDFNPFSFHNDDFLSLPSGHTSFAFSLSTVLAENVESDFLKIIIYIPAVATAFSRVYQDQHWTSDVFMGAAIGYFVGKWVTAKHQQNIYVNRQPGELFSISIPF